HDFDALEDDGLVRDQHRERIPSRGGEIRFAQHATPFGVDRTLVMKREDPGRTQDRLPKPANAEEQQERAHNDLKIVDRNCRDRGPEYRDDRSECRETGHRPDPGGAPTRATPTESTIVAASIASTEAPRKAAVSCGAPCIQIDMASVPGCGVSRRRPPNRGTGGERHGNREGGKIDRVHRAEHASGCYE